MAKREALRLRLARTKTLDELQAMMNEIENDPDSKAGATGLNIFNKSASKKQDEISWAMYYIEKKGKSEYVPPAPSPQMKNW